MIDLIEDDLPVAVRKSDDGELYEFGVVWKDSFIVLIATKVGYVDVVHERVAAERTALEELAAERVRAERQAAWEKAEDERLAAEQAAAEEAAKPAAKKPAGKAADAGTSAGSTTTK